MKRKRKVKLLMACGYSRNAANHHASKMPGSVVEYIKEYSYNPTRWGTRPETVKRLVMNLGLLPYIRSRAQGMTDKFYRDCYRA